MILSEAFNGTTTNTCLRLCATGSCNSWCISHCTHTCHFTEIRHSHRYSTLQIATISIVGAVLIGIICCICYKASLTPSRPRTGVLGIAREDIEDEERGRVNGWQQGSVGLEPSIIGSITAFKYEQKGEFAESTECAVCLSEFQEGEELRLLPICSHVFHVPCIDKWLVTHVNCPTCRAKIVASSEGESEVEEGQGSVGG